MLMVPGRPSEDGLVWWVLLDPGRGPPRARVLEAGDARIVTHALRRGRDPRLGEPWLVAATGLAPDRPHTLEVSVDQETARALPQRTLPGALGLHDRFTVSFGSCYSFKEDRDGPAMFPSYPPLPHREGAGDPIRVRFLCGDQIYMDLGGNTGLPLLVPPKPAQRYMEQWRSPLFAPFLAASPSVFVADDHEFWNNYPEGNPQLLWDKGGRNGSLARRLDRAFSMFQTALNLDPHRVVDDDATMDARLADEGRSFRLPGGGVDFFVLDTRTERRPDNPNPKFAADAWMIELETWAAALRGPGVLVVGPPPVRKKANPVKKFFGLVFDLNLPDFPTQFSRLWNALFDAPHDVLVLSGDIHWSRLNVVMRNGDASGRRVFEFVCSPLVHIPQGKKKSPPDTLSGTVEWRDGTASWARMTNRLSPGSEDRFASVATRMFATATFRQPGGPSTPMTVAARTWKPRPSGVAQLLLENTFTMR